MTFATLFTDFYSEIGLIKALSPAFLQFLGQIKSILAQYLNRNIEFKFETDWYQVFIN